MVFKFYFSEYAAEKLEKLIPYIELKWGISARNNFVEKFNASLGKIETFPESSMKISKYSGIYK
jgi:plasmid stabilization system protein ParE